MKFIFFFLIFFPISFFASGIEDAKTYHGNSKLQWNIAMETIDLIPWDGSEKVLDVGCGDGKITAFLSQKMPRGLILGVDISQSMIDFALAYYPQSDYCNLNFQRQNASEISFENQFTRVVSFSALHWVLDQEKALKAIHRALVPGGKICIQTYGKGSMNVTDIADFLVHTEKWKSYFPSYVKQRVFFTEEEYYVLLEKVGFREVQVIGSWSETFFSDRQALVDFIKPLLNFISHLSQDLQKEFIEEVVNNIVSIAGLIDEDVICYKTFNLQALGVK